jgi:two-component system cell cycle response regulator
MVMTETTGRSLREALADTRARFIATFSARCDAALVLVHAPSTAGDPGPIRHFAHGLAGLSGMAGFPAVCEQARQLEDLVRTSPVDAATAARVRDRISLLRQAFVKDLASEFRNRAGAPVTNQGQGRVLIAEDDDDQRAVMAGYLADAGYEPVPVQSGDDVVAAARRSRPAVIVLDVGLPGTDGFSLCQQLKADADLARIPVLFVSARAGVDERLAGLALGADDYVTKPADMRELAIRVDRARARGTAVETAGVLSYAEFFERGRAWLARSPAAVVFLRTAPDHMEAVIAMVRREVRTRDLVGTYDSANLVLLLPELPAATADDRITGMIKRLHERGVPLVTAGIALSSSEGGSIMDLMRDAHEALIEARYLGNPTAVSGAHQRPARDADDDSLTILLVDDDPDVARIVDAQLRAAGHTCALAFDGEQALEAVDRVHPDVVMLDLMMPRLGGFEVLARLNQREGRRPPVVILSARGRETDVTRAFDLGAADYVTKPFSPQELLARVARLAR